MMTSVILRYPEDGLISRKRLAFNIFKLFSLVNNDNDVTFGLTKVSKVLYHLYLSEQSFVLTEMKARCSLYATALSIYIELFW